MSLICSWFRLVICLTLLLPSVLFAADADTFGYYSLDGHLRNEATWGDKLRVHGLVSFTRDALHQSEDQGYGALTLEYNEDAIQVTTKPIFALGVNELVVELFIKMARLKPRDLPILTVYTDDGSYSDYPLLSHTHPLMRLAFTPGKWQKYTVLLTRDGASLFIDDQHVQSASFTQNTESDEFGHLPFAIVVENLFGSIDEITILRAGEEDIAVAAFAMEQLRRQAEQKAIADKQKSDAEEDQSNTAARVNGDAKDGAEKPGPAKDANNQAGRKRLKVVTIRVVDEPHSSYTASQQNIDSESTPQQSPQILQQDHTPAVPTPATNIEPGKIKLEELSANSNPPIDATVSKDTNASQRLVLSEQARHAIEMLNAAGEDSQERSDEPVIQSNDGDDAQRYAEDDEDLNAEFSEEDEDEILRLEAEQEYEEENPEVFLEDNEDESDQFLYEESSDRPPDPRADYIDRSESDTQDYSITDEDQSVNVSDFDPDDADLADMNEDDVFEREGNEGLDDNSQTTAVNNNIASNQSSTQIRSDDDSQSDLVRLDEVDDLASGNSIVNTGGGIGVVSRQTDSNTNDNGNNQQSTVPTNPVISPQLTSTEDRIQVTQTIHDFQPNNASLDADADVISWFEVDNSGHDQRSNSSPIVLHGNAHYDQDNFFWPDNPNGSAVRLTTFGDALSAGIPGSILSHNTSSNGVSIEAMVYSENWHLGADAVATRLIGLVAEDGVELSLVSESGLLSVQAGNSRSPLSNRLSNLLAPGEWHHLRMTLTTTQWSITVDGQPGINGSMTTGGIDDWPVNAPVTMVGGGFRGWIDDLVVRSYLGTTLLSLP